MAYPEQSNKSFYPTPLHCYNRWAAVSNPRVKEFYARIRVFPHADGTGRAEKMGWIDHFPGLFHSGSAANFHRD